MALKLDHEIAFERRLHKRRHEIMFTCVRLTFDVSFLVTSECMYTRPCINSIRNDMLIHGYVLLLIPRNTAFTIMMTKILVSWKRHTTRCRLCILVNFHVLLSSSGFFFSDSVGPDPGPNGLQRLPADDEASPLAREELITEYPLFC